MLRAATLIGSAVVGASAAPSLTNWASHGEVMAESELSQPAIHDDLLAAIGKEASWVAGTNSIFEGATLRDVKQRLGTLQNTDPSSFLPYKAPEKLVDVPAEFDWRTDPRAANCPSLKEIRDQSNCGSCWAFGSVEAMTDRICIASKGKDTTHLSAQDVTSCDHLGDMGCSGGVPSTAYTYYKTSGVVDGGNYGDKKGCYSYQMAPCAHHSASSKYANCTGDNPTPKCASSCVDDSASWSGSKKHGTGGYSVCQQGGNTSCPDAMMQEIYQNGPITGMFFVHQSFTAYKSGVYKAGNFFKDPMLGGHAIKIMGWGTEDGQPYWLVANSWNEDWGLQGYFKIDRGHDQCQIENPVINGGPVAGMPKLSIDEVVV
jgi:cathepsin B